jgi:hypothetical protein
VENRFGIFRQSDRTLNSANFLAIGAKINEGESKLAARRVP